MCFSPQRRTIFRHLDFKKCSETDVFCTFSLQNLHFTTAACIFSTSELQKVLRHRQFFSIFTSKCAFRHSGVQFLISPLSSYLRARRFNRPTFGLTRHTNHWKNTAFRDFSNIWRGYIFFLLTFALLHLLSADLTTLLCFSTVHIEFLFKLPSTKYYSSTTLYYKEYSGTTKYYSGTTLKRHLQCAEQQASPSHLTKYGACHPKWMSSGIRVTYETSFPMRRAARVTLQRHQILCLPRKMNLMIDPHHIWNVIYNAQSNRHQPPTSPNTAPAPQNESHDWSASHMKRHLQCAEQQASTSNLTKYCACPAKWISWLIRITYETSFTMRGATGINLQPHQILRLPRKMNLMINPHHIWNVIYNKRSDRHHPPTSPNTAPATQNDRPTSDRNLRKTAETSFPMRDRSETVRPWSDPENANRNPPRHRGYFSHSPGADSFENYNVSRSGYHSKFHHMLRLPRKVTHEPHQMLRLPRKVTHELHQMLRLPRKVTHELHQMLRLRHMTTTTTTTTTTTPTRTT